MINSKREAFALHLGLDFSETNDYRYHYGRTTQPVWAINDAYYCVTKKNQKTAEHPHMDFTWVEVVDAHLNIAGYKIWKSSENR